MLSVTLFNTHFVLNAMDSSGFYKVAANHIYESMVDIGIPSGLDSSVFTDIVSSNDIQEQMQTTLQNTGDAKQAEFKSKLKKRIEDYAKSMNMSLDDQTQTEIDGLITDCFNEYRAQLQLKFMELYARNCPTFNQYALGSAAVLLVALITLVALLKRISFWPHRFWGHLSQAYIACGLAMLPFVLMYIFRPYTRLQLYPEHFYQFIIKAIDHYLLWESLLTAILFLIAAWMGWVYHKKRQHQIALSRQKKNESLLLEEDEETE
jgi:cbb3-type cytochrome oxidase subunit 3